MKRLPTTEKRGGSFHYNYPGYDKYSKEENCLCCTNAPAPDFLVDIAELDYAFATAEKIAQGKLFGKCHVLIKNHYVNFEDINHDDMVGFMSEIQLVGNALKKVTGAVKINYEIHSNSGPHIHCHLFPRYLDDDFPSAPIDYRICEPSPYESEEEFSWFVQRIREELIKG
ncbi:MULTISPECIES: HIT family protein [unclassified Fusibacter]|uniref:HIT family protein n=1 Tax=unclassified Fusibacter TaxID=2624464 RepID=UPI0013E97A8D|nr:MULTISPECIES: HIT family protein [unclassified Fusibacter]MCK8058557.1 HIT family protein [Fusibacter sp. A2]NPE22674.1 HIT family protein [Fusibacter sp. A1]